MADWVSGLFGLGGVTLGVLFTSLWEYQKQRRNESKDAAYLAAIVSVELERFGSKCLDVVYDDGLREGQRDENDCKSPQVKAPQFDPGKYDVEWRSLSRQLMFAILDLPYLIERANESIAAMYAYGDGPPDYDDYFHQRQYEYAMLGIKAASLAMDLRAYVGVRNSELEQSDTHRRLDEELAAIRLRREKHLQLLKESISLQGINFDN